MHINIKPANDFLYFLISGDGKWVTERSLSVYADDSVVQDVLESQLNRLSSGLETPNRISSLMVAWRSYPGKDMTALRPSFNRLIFRM